MEKPLDMNTIYQELARQLLGAPDSFPPEVEEHPTVLSEIDGFDQQTGMEVFGGSASEYTTFLRIFVKRYQDGLDINPEDREALADAMRQIHWEAERLGNEMLEQAAMGAQNIFSGPETAPKEIRATFDQMDLLLSAVVESVAESLEREPESPLRYTPEDSLLRSLLERLRTEIAEDDAEALQTFRSGSALIEKKIPDSVAILEGFLSAYAFDEALEYIDALLVKLPAN